MLDVYMSLNRFVEAILTWSVISFGELATYSMPIFFALLLGLESQFPYKKWPSKKWLQSWWTNVNLFIFNNTVLSLASASTLLALAEHYSETGLLSQLSNPLAQIILSFLLLDIILYFWHRACHNFDGLWMFHKVHHSDPYLNVSTAFRMHILELIIVTVLKAVSIVMLGISKVSVLAYETIMTLFVMFHHTNITFVGEILLGRLVIVPSLHRTHHSTERCEHDTNLGAIFSIWDRIFGTFLEKEPVEIGIKNNAPLGFLEQLKFGFTHGSMPAPKSTPTVSNCPVNVNVNAMIAEAAYYKAQKRGFSPGSDMDDWLQAEREIKQRLYQDRPKPSGNPGKSRKTFGARTGGMTY